MQRDLRTFLADIQQCIVEIKVFVSGKTLADYLNDILVRRAVEREFIIIAEALSRISQMSAELRIRVDHVRNIADFRNVLVHDYPDVDDEYVWKIIEESVPLLQRQIDAWAEELGHRQS